VSQSPISIGDNNRGDNDRNIRPHRKAIRDMLPIIDPEEDYLTIVAAEEKIASTETKRKKELEEAHANLKGQQPPRAVTSG
jgi:hypothetical protein